MCKKRCREKYVDPSIELNSWLISSSVANTSTSDWCDPNLSWLICDKARIRSKKSDHERPGAAQYTIQSPGKRQKNVNHMAFKVWKKAFDRSRVRKDRMERWILTKGSVRIHVGTRWASSICCCCQRMAAGKPSLLRAYCKRRLEVYLIDRLSSIIGRMP